MLLRSHGGQRTRAAVGRLPRVRWARLTGLAAATLFAHLGYTAETLPSPPPQESGLVERAGRRLFQLDVTVRGPGGEIEKLVAEDFELVVSGQEIKQFLVDKLCAIGGETGPGASTEDSGPARGERPNQGSKATYLFYFDQTHLTMAGRQRALDLSKQLIAELIPGGSRALIVSSSDEVRTFSDLTDDVDVLIAALKRVEHDRKQFDPFPSGEDDRIREVQRQLADSLNFAIATARWYQSEERWKAERALRRFAMVLGRMIDVDSPKTVFYFADTMRRNAGAHYANLFSAMEASRLEGPFDASFAFDQVIEAAASQGIRLYPVQAAGLLAPSPLGFRDTRVSEAQGTLASLALETGGQHFINGVPVRKMLPRIRDDLGCLYLLSFDPAGLPQDKTLPVLLRVRRPGIRVHVRGVVVIQSESNRLTSRLMAAFAAPDAVQTGNRLHQTLIPNGYREGKYSAVVQMTAPGSPLPGATWDLGVSLVSRGEVKEDASGRISVDIPGVPMVLEAEMTFKPGPYEVVAVAHDATANETATGRLEGSWPDPDAAMATVGPIAVLQPTAGLFLRGGELRRHGSLGLGEAEPARTDRPTALVGIICRARNKKGTLVVERRLVGEPTATFPELQLEYVKDERCAQFRDVVPAGSMSPGTFRYEVSVLDGELEVATGARELRLAAPAEEGRAAR